MGDRIVLMRAGRHRAGRRGAEELYRGRRTCSRRASSAISTSSRARCRRPASKRRSARSPHRACRRERGRGLHPAAGVRLRAGGLGLPGRVLSRRFLGEVDLFEVAVQGSTRPSRARVARARDRLRAAQECGVESIRTTFLFSPSTGRLGCRPVHDKSAAAASRGRARAHGRRRWVASASGIGSSSVVVHAAVRPRQDLRADGRHGQGHQELQEGHGRRGRPDRRAEPAHRRAPRVEATQDRRPKRKAAKRAEAADEGRMRAHGGRRTGTGPFEPG